ncbi:hypothetical protein [Kutzneria buriramensis]|uniref:Uncharacterized protein n=1 Tax=Kutzneria buriramensis TaxID=1045776 RepID=A0A3E0GT87_9PSEU|nr:hypothetical protein [Kutzneria buriramensis]REH26003.1 hypothetical protein BCF44_13542 [Kutzneria buriramensis]
MTSSLFTDATFDAAQAMDAAARAVTGTPLSPQAAAEGMSKLIEVADHLRIVARRLAHESRLTAHGGNPTATEQVVDITRSVVDHLRQAETEAGITRDAFKDVHGELGDLVAAVRGTAFTF